MLVSYSRRSHLVAGVKSCLKEINAQAIIQDNTVSVLGHYLPSSLSSFQNYVNLVKVRSRLLNFPADTFLTCCCCFNLFFKNIFGKRLPRIVGGILKADHFILKFLCFSLATPTCGAFYCLFCGCVCLRTHSLVSYL